MEADRSAAYTCRSCGFATALCVCSDGPRDPETGHTTSAAFSYDYERILDLVQRIQHCQRDVSNSIHDRTLEGSLRARNYAEQIRVDVSELQDLLLERHLAIQKEADSRV